MKERELARVLVERDGRRRAGGVPDWVEDWYEAKIKMLRAELKVQTHKEVSCQKPPSRPGARLSWRAG